MNLISKFWLEARQNAVRTVVSNHGTCLDIGCGDYPIYPTCTTLDIDEKVEADYHADACNMPFDDETFDRVFCLEVVEHISDIKKFYVEAARILKLRGILIITSPVNNIIWKVLWYFWSHIFGRKWLGTHCKYFDIEEMKEFFNIIHHKKINGYLHLVVGERLDDCNR